MVFFHIHLSTEIGHYYSSYSLSASKMEAKEHLLKFNPHWFYAQQARGQQEFCQVCTFTNETVAVDFQKNISTNMPSYKANHCIGVPWVWQVKCWQIHSQEHSHNYSVKTRLKKSIRRLHQCALKMLSNAFVNRFPMNYLNLLEERG